MKNLSLVALALLAFTAATSTNAQAVKWHPGHYMSLNTGGSQSENFKHLEEVSREPVIKGVQLYVWWSELERSKGVYDFSKIDLYLNKMKSLPAAKRLVVRVMDRRFGGTSKTGIVPSYLLSDPTYKGGVALLASSGYVSRLWEPAVMDRLIALYRALGARYDADPYVEGFATEETSISLASPTPSGYSTTALFNQYLRFAASARQTMLRSNLFMGTNFVKSDEQMAVLIQALFEAHVAPGGPSTVPNKLTQAQRVWTGATGADYRGLIAIGPGIEAAVFGGKNGSFTPKQIGDFAYKTLGVTHLFWVRNTFTGTAAQKWSTGILPYLRTNPPTRTACPSSYGLCNTK